MQIRRGVRNNKHNHAIGTNRKRDGMRARAYRKGSKSCHATSRYCGALRIFCLLVPITRTAASEKENVRSRKTKSMVFERRCFIAAVFPYKCTSGVEFKGPESFATEPDSIVLEAFQRVPSQKMVCLLPVSVLRSANSQL